MADLRYPRGSARFTDGKLAKPLIVTVLHNGVVTQNHTALIGENPHKKVGTYTAHPEKGRSSSRTTAPDALPQHLDSRDAHAYAGRHRRRPEDRAVIHRAAIDENPTCRARRVPFPQRCSGPVRRSRAAGSRFRFTWLEAPGARADRGQGSCAITPSGYFLSQRQPRDVLLARCCGAGSPRPIPTTCARSCGIWRIGRWMAATSSPVKCA